MNPPFNTPKVAGDDAVEPYDFDTDALPFSLKPGANGFSTVRGGALDIREGVKGVLDRNPFSKENKAEDPLLAAADEAISEIKEEEAEKAEEKAEAAEESAETEKQEEPADDKPADDADKADEKSEETA